MTTRKQIEANRRNARYSTGPRSKKGKDKVKRNAVGHGLTGADILIPGEKIEDFDAFSKRLSGVLEPEGALEQELSDRVCACLWRLQRIMRIEAGILAWQHHDIRVERALERTQHAQFNENLPPDYENIRNVKKFDAGKRDLEKAKAARRNRIPTLGLAFIRDVNGANALGKLTRHEATVERALYRALHELQRIQTARLGGQIPVPIALDLTIDSD